MHMRSRSNHDSEEGWVSIIQPRDQRIRGLKNSAQAFTDLGLQYVETRATTQKLQSHPEQMVLLLLPS